MIWGNFIFSDTAVDADLFGLVLLSTATDTDVKTVQYNNTSTAVILLLIVNSEQDLGLQMIAKV